MKADFSLERWSRLYSIRVLLTSKCSDRNRSDISGDPVLNSAYRTVRYTQRKVLDPHSTQPPTQIIVLYAIYQMPTAHLLIHPFDHPFI